MDAFLSGWALKSYGWSGRMQILRSVLFYVSSLWARVLSFFSLIFLFLLFFLLDFSSTWCRVGYSSWCWMKTVTRDSSSHGVARDPKILSLHQSTPWGSYFSAPQWVPTPVGSQSGVLARAAAPEPQCEVTFVWLCWFFISHRSCVTSEKRYWMWRSSSLKDVQKVWEIYMIDSYHVDSFN